MQLKVCKVKQIFKFCVKVKAFKKLYWSFYMSEYQWMKTAPLLADLFLYSYEAEFIPDLLKSGEKKLDILIMCIY